jgi:hypothetical protein
VTIPDAVFVIDTGKVKESRYKDTSKLQGILLNSLICKMFELAERFERTAIRIMSDFSLEYLPYQGCISWASQYYKRNVKAIESHPTLKERKALIPN